MAKSYKTVVRLLLTEAREGLEKGIKSGDQSLYRTALERIETIAVEAIGGEAVAGRR